MKKFLKWAGIVIGAIILIIVVLIAYVLISHDRYGFYPSGGVLSENQAQYDVLYYDLNLEIFAEDQCIAGYNIIKIRALSDSLSHIDIDLIDNFDVSGITLLPATELNFTHNDDLIRAELNNPPAKGSVIDLKIEYAGQPVEALMPPWIGGFNWSKDSLDYHWIGVSCQGEGGKIWFPCKDHPSDRPDSVALSITIPESYYCAANGMLDIVSVPRNGFKTFHWKTRYPINNYNININIGNYKIIEETYETMDGQMMPVIFYYLPQSEDGAQAHLEMAVDMLYTYRKFYGEYPFTEEKFAIVHTDYLGMEHQTINAYGNNYEYRTFYDHAYDLLMLHEMGHEWWGNKVTIKDWADFWIHEGICTYGEALYHLDKSGDSAYHDYMDKIRKRVRNRNPIIPKRNATSQESYSGDIYAKGACLMHSLRFLLGDSLFFNTLKTLAIDSAYTYDRFVTTADFIHLIEAKSQKDYSAYIKSFLYTTNLPQVQVDSLGANQYEVSIPNIVEYTLPMAITLSDTIIVKNLGSEPLMVESAMPPVVDAKNWFLKQRNFRKEK